MEDIRTLLLIFLFYPCSDSQNPNKMILIHGEPLINSSPQVFDYSWDYCTSYCYQDTRCLAAYYSDLNPGQCQIFYIGQISEIQQLDAYSGKAMALKMLANTSNQCSLTPGGNSMGGVISTNSTYQNYSISVDQASGIWTIQASPYYWCPDNFMLWHRYLGLWCMGIFYKSSPSGISQIYSTEMCGKVGAILSGFDSTAEKDWIAGEVKSKLQSPYSYYGYWVNGVRRDDCMFANQTKPACDLLGAFQITDPTMYYNNSYQWGRDGQPNGMGDNKGTSNCLVFRVGPETGAGIDDLPCDSTKDSTKTFNNGFICGTRPNEE